MKKTIVLHITGDDDYAALTFEQEMGIKKAKELISRGEKIEGECFRGEIFEFGEVDKAFIDFINNNIQDYDDMKHNNFYILN